MKNILKAIAVTTAVVGMSGSVAFADTVTCNGSISNTGPGSTNTVNCVDNENNQVTCNNNIIVTSTNDQTSSTGGAFTTGNTTGGGAQSGDSENVNEVVVEVGASCTPVAVAVATTPTPTTSTPQVLADQVVVKPVGGAGAGAGSAVSSDKTAATVGLLGSAGLIALGFRLRKNVFGRN